VSLDIEQVYRDHGHVVLRRARQILGNEADAREVLHDVFVSLIRAPSQYRGTSSVTTFLYAMTTNVCLNQIRNRRRRAELVEQKLMPREEAGGAEPSHLALVRELLVRLPERLARVAIYHFVDEMTHDEIAEHLGVSRRQIGNLVEQAREEVRRCA
jgi:RNA polymerase sigma-70 factor (ECF subfamily)